MKSRRTDHTPARRPARGFTLIELMVTVCVIGILASIAYPSYRKHVIRSTRAEARAAVLDAVSRQQQYYLDNKTYTTNFADLQLPTKSEQGHYTLSVDAATSSCPLSRCYVLRATATDAQAADKECTALAMDSNGTKTSTGTLTTGCW